MEDDVQDYNDVQGLIQHAMDQDFNKANKIFGDIMTIKVQDMLDQEKVRLADQIYNGGEPDDEDEEQLEMDFDDEDLEFDEDELSEYEFDDDDDDDDEEEDE